MITVRSSVGTVVGYMGQVGVGNVTLQIDQAGPAGIMQPRVVGEYKNPMLHFFGATFHWN